MQVIRKIVAGVAMILAMTGAAQAAPYNLGQLSSLPAVITPVVAVGSFSDTINFSVGSPSSVGATTTNLQLAVAPGVTFDIQGLGMTLFSGITPLATGLSFSNLALGAGSYYAVVTGVGSGTAGGLYSFVAAASPVPLPAAFWFLATGFAGLIALARRNRNSVSQALPLAA